MEENLNQLSQTTIFSDLLIVNHIGLTSSSPQEQEPKALNTSNSQNFNSSTLMMDSIMFAKLLSQSSLNDIADNSIFDNKHPSTAIATSLSPSQVKKIANRYPLENSITGTFGLKKQFSTFPADMHSFQQHMTSSPSAMVPHGCTNNYDNTKDCAPQEPHMSSLITGQSSEVVIIPTSLPVEYNHNSSECTSGWYPPSSSASKQAALTSPSTSEPIFKTVKAISMSSVYFPPSASALHQKRRKAKRQALRAPRPKNCFMLYRSIILPMIMVELGMINNRVISKIAAERWRTESESVKAWYKLMASRGKEEHARIHPGYKYTPHKKLIAMTAATETMFTLNGNICYPINDSFDVPASVNNSRIEVGYTNQFESVQDASISNFNKRIRLNEHVPEQSLLQKKRPKKGYRLRGQSTGANTGTEGCNSHGSSVIVQSDCPSISRMSPSGYSRPTAFSTWKGHSLIEQQLYLGLEENKSRRTLQQPHPQHQSQSIPFLWQAYSLFTGDTSNQTRFSLPKHALPSDNSFSSGTLVDPIDNCINHEYAFAENMDSQGLLSEQSNAPFYYDCCSKMPLRTDLPYFIYDAAKISSNDSNSILSQLNSEYEHNQTWMPNDVCEINVPLFGVKGSETFLDPSSMQYINPEDFQQPYSVETTPYLSVQGSQFQPNLIIPLARQG